MATPEGQKPKPKAQPAPATQLAIQEEVKRQLQEKVAGYKWAFGILSLAVFIACGFTIIDIRGKFKDWLASTLIVSKAAKIDEIHTNSVASWTGFSNQMNTAFQQVALLSNQVQEVKQIKNLVTTSEIEGMITNLTALTSQVNDLLVRTTYYAAKNGDALAFDQIFSWSTNQSHPFFPRATVYYADLVSLSGPFNQLGLQYMITHTTWDLSTGFEQARQKLISAESAAKGTILQTILAATNFTAFDKTKLLVETAVYDPTIQGRIAATEALNKESGLNVAPHRPKEFLDWWNTNQIRYARMTNLQAQP